MNSPRKILAVKLRALGDTVLMTAPLLELRRAYPEAEIHAIVTASWAPLLEGHPGVNRVLTYERRKEPTSRAKTLARLALQFRREHYDAALNFHASPSSATLCFATGARMRSIHFHGHRDRNRYSTVEIPGKGVVKPIIERDMDVLRGIGVHVPAGRLPKIFLQQAELDAAKARVEELGLAKPLLGLGLGASRPSKAWPLERHAALAISWCRKTSGSVMAVMSQPESELGHEFMKRLDDLLHTDVADPAERASIRTRIACEIGLPVRQLAAMIAQCDVFGGNDSGPRHLAVAVETPTVTLFGPEDPFEWHPYPVEKHPYFYVDGLGCRKDADPGKPAWCAVHTCIEQEHQCMKKIGIESVLSQCLKLL